MLNSNINNKAEASDLEAISEKFVIGYNEITLKNNESYFIIAQAFSARKNGYIGIVLGGYDIATLLNTGEIKEPVRIEDCKYSITSDWGGVRIIAIKMD